MGLPGAGKTSLAKELSKLIDGVVFNADQVRQNINVDLGFSLQDRVEQARRMSWLCDRVVEAHSFAVADFVCPTMLTRECFNADFTIWVDRIKESRFSDTNALFEPPTTFDVRVTSEGSPRYWAERIAALLLNRFNPQLPTALFVGRFQPFHDGHLALIEEGLKRVGQACIAVRDTHNIDDGNPFSFSEVKQRIELGLKNYRGQFSVVSLPNISHIFYGRDVGYDLTEIKLPHEMLTISATKLRNEIKRSP